MKEKTIAKFKYENSTYKLLEITIFTLNKAERTCHNENHYLITLNRRRIAQSKWKETAQKKFANLIVEELMQTNITF